MTHLLTVGQPYTAAATTWPDHTSRWMIEPDLVQLAVFIPDPDLTQRQDFLYGQVHFALVTGDHALILAFKLGGMEWWDAPWRAVRQVPVAEPGLPEIPDGGLLKVLMVLVDSRTGLVQAMRGTTWPSELVQRVRRNVAHQLGHRSEDRAGEIEIDTWQRRYLTPAELVVARAEMVVRGL